MRKRLLLIGLVLFSALALTSCGNNDDIDDSEDDVKPGTAVSGAVTVKDGDGVEHTYNRTVGGTVADCVDLGLPSGTLWATHNVGATNVYDCGAYFAWGEVGAAEEGYSNGIKISEKYGKSWYGYLYYGCNNFKYINENSSDEYHKYDKYVILEPMGKVDNKTTLEPCDDAAYVNWGSAWCMPTPEQFEELYHNTTVKWYEAGNTEFNGVAGAKFTSTVNGFTNKYIFIPAGGYGNCESISENKKKVYIWSSSLWTPASAYACGLTYNPDTGIGFTIFDRYFGQNVRPVRSK